MAEETTALDYQREDRLHEAIASFEQARDAGAAPDPCQWLDRYPEVAGRLAEYFADQNELRRRLGDARPDSPPGQALPLEMAPQIPDYEIVGEIGHGGMGVIYKARQVSADRIVALKVIRTDRLEQPSPEERRKAVERFVTEAQAAARLKHENIVSVYEVGEVGGRPFYSMHFVEGSSLHDLVQPGPLESRRAAAYLAAVARAVHEAHRHGILHRDLKPHNILVEARSDRPLVADFGLAKLLQDGPHLTRTGDVMGTPPYMSPEQAQGSASLTVATDVYGLGASLYALLTGRPPFQGEDPVQTLRRVVEDEPAPPRTLNPHVERDLETICLKCLEKDAARRYASAEALEADLKRWLRGEPIVARPAGRLERALKWAKRRPAAAGLVAVSGLAAVVLVAGSLLANVLIGAQQRRTQQALVAEQRLTYVHSVALAQREWQANNVARADELLDNCPADLRHWEWHYVKRLCHAELLQLGVYSHANIGLAFHPDGKRLATSGWKELKIWDADTGKELVQSPAEGWVSALAFSNDGARIVTAAFGTLTVWEALSGKEVVRVKAHEFLITSVAFSPDGKRIASASGTPSGIGRQESGEVRLWDAASGMELLTFPGLPHWANTVAFSPDSKYLAAGLGDLAVLAPARPGEVRVRVWDAATGREIHNLRGHTFWVTSVAFSPDSRRLASAGADGTVRVWDLKTGQEVLTLRGHSRWVRAVAFSPDGKLLASAGDDQIVKIWDAATGNEVLTLRGHRHRVLAIAFCPDCRRLASASGPSPGPGEVKIWDITTSQEARTLRGHTAAVTSVAFSPDSKVLASVSKGMNDAQPGEALLWDLAGGRKVKTIRGQLSHLLSGFTRVTFSPDGLMIATSGGKGVEFWDRVTGQRLHVLPIGGPPLGLALSPDGKWVAACGEGAFRDPSGHMISTGVVVWDRATGKGRLNFRAHTIYTTDLAFSPNSRHLATCTAGGNLTEGVAPNEVKVWDVETGKELRVLRGGGLAVVYSPQGEQLASSNPDGSVQVWDSATGQELFRLGGHSASVRSLAYSPDGQRIITGSDDYTVKVWDALTGQELLTLRGHNEPVTAVAFSPDGWQIASGSGDRGEPGEVKVWDATPAPR